MAGIAGLFLSRKKTALPISLPAIAPVAVPSPAPPVTVSTQEPPVLEDEQGAYQLFERTRKVLRKTRIEGLLEGKYWGEEDPLMGRDFHQSHFYTFSMYEAHIHDMRLTATSAALPGTPVSKEKLPALLTASLPGEDRRFKINIHEPHVDEVLFNQMLHQQDGHEVFGTVHATIYGYLVDVVPETYTEKRYLHKHVAFTPEPEPISGNIASVPSGSMERRGNYVRGEFISPNRRHWSNWEYKPRYRRSGWATGCAGVVVGIPLIILGCIVLTMLAPFWRITLPAIGILLALRLVPAIVWEWISRLALAAIALIFIAGLFFATPAHRAPAPVRARAWRQTVRPAPTTTAHTPADMLISHYATWQDYNGQQYAGNLFVYNSAYQAAHQYKQQLAMSMSSPQEYDAVLHQLKAHDAGSLGGVYHLFDSIQLQKKLPATTFAEMVVSFVQQIPYALVLPGACDPALYSDHFIRTQLSRADAQCDGDERFGINTPVEFMATLKGDCDTRTLLLYTMLAHYDYDVCLLSSEHYNHSVIAINLPYSGQYFNYQQTHYVFWETTSPGFQPGVLPASVNDPAYWRISLKSK